MNTAKKRPSSPNNVNGYDAIEMLKADHDKVKDMFKQFDELMDQDGSKKEKTALAQRICDALKIHSQIEEEIFYPAVRLAIDDDDLVDEAEAEHASIKELVEQIEAMHAGDDRYDAKVIVLGEQVEHHVVEEEDEMFPMVKSAKVDTAGLGAQMHQRKQALMAELGVREEHDDGMAAASKKKSKPTHGRAFS